jgi:hypothetical protein
MHFRIAAVIALIGSTVACAGSEGGSGMPSVVSDAYGSQAAPPMDAARKVADQDCSQTLELDRGNLRCR